MGIAFSDSVVTIELAPATSRAVLIAQLAAALVEAGWTAYAIDTGYKMLATSQQGFQALLWLEDLGENWVSTYGPSISLHMTCADETSPSPMRKLITLDREYTVIAGDCQMWLALPGVANEAAPDGFWGHHFACGIPWLPENATGPCAERLNTSVTDAWWLSSSGGHSGAHSFRTGWYHDYSNWAGYWSTDGLKKRDGAGAHLQQRIISLGDPAYADLAPAVYADGSPMYLDPLIAWGVPNTGGPPLVRGQLWDAVWATAPLVLGQKIEIDEYEFECWMQSDDQLVGSTRLGCLCVATGEGQIRPEEANYAY